MLNGAYLRIGLFIALVLLVGQLLYFNLDTFSRSPTLRPSLEQLCLQLDCQLPIYKNIEELVILQNSISTLTDRSQLFMVTINNKATFAQPYPNLKLNLYDYAGNLTATRIFLPQDYLPKAPVTTPILQPEASLVVNLNIAELKTKIGGYTFELVY